MLSYQIHDGYSNVLSVVMTTTVSHYPSQETTGDGLIPRCHAQRDGTGMWIVAVHHQPFYSSLLVFISVTYYTISVSIIPLFSFLL